MKRKLTFGRLIIYAILCLAAMACLLPFVHILALSFSSSAAVNGKMVSLLPVDFTLESYRFVLRNKQFMTSLWVSVRRVFFGVSLNLVMMILTAYPLSKDDHALPGRTAVSWYFVITMLISGGMIPLYLVIVKLKLINSMLALILPGALPVGNMIILMNFFRTLPKELEEAAQIDGAGPVRVLFSVLLPVAKPSLATVGLFCIVSHWNSWFDGLIYMNQSSMQPLQTYLQTLIVDPETMLRSTGEDYVRLMAVLNARTARAAQLFLGMLPVLVIYPFLQKYFTKGLVLGSVKG